MRVRLRQQGTFRLFRGGGDREREKLETESEKDTYIYRVRERVGGREDEESGCGHTSSVGNRLSKSEAPIHMHAVLYKR